VCRHPRLDVAVQDRHLADVETRALRETAPVE
jgi:hypothetical protein